jgi:hypothetical protein
VECKFECPWPRVSIHNGDEHHHGEKSGMTTDVCILIMFVLNK